MKQKILIGCGLLLLISSNTLYAQYEQYRYDSSSRGFIAVEKPKRGQFQRFNAGLLNQMFRTRPVKKKVEPKDKKSADFLSPKKPALQKVSSDKWIYVIAPHPDDEVLCCSNTLKKKIADGENIKVVFFTDGDALDKNHPKISQQYGKLRRLESKQAAKKIGIQEKDLIFLNFPDGHLDKLKENKVLTSQYTKQNKSLKESFFPASLYTKKNLRKNLESLFASFPPKEVYLPTEEDTHSDHVAAGKITQETLKSLSKNIKVLGYQIHGKKTGTAKKSVWKQNLIGLFASQFHDHHHKEYLQRFASWKEEFQVLSQ